MNAQKKSQTHIATRLGSLLILLTAVIAGAGVWWQVMVYEAPKQIDVEEIIAQIKAHRALSDKKDQM
jgi:hypothetical protein